MQNSLFALFIRWFLIVVPAQIVKTGRNFLAWAWQYFSIGYFTGHMFDPWHRDITGYGIGFDFKRWLHVMGWNAISRLLGAVMRFTVLCFGILACLGITAVTAFLFLFWFAMPAVILFLILIGNYSLFR